MNTRYKIHALTRFPSLVPNETGQRIFLDEFGGQRFYVRFYGATQREKVSYARQVARFLEGRVRTPPIYDCGVIASGWRIFSYISEPEAAGRPYAATQEDGKLVARGLQQWHDLPRDSQLWRREQEHYDKRIVSLRVSLAAEPYERVAAVYKRLASPAMFTDSIVSHGDIAPGNMVIDGDDIVWIDLEQVSLRPRAADIAEVLFNFLLGGLFQSIESSNPAVAKAAAASWPAQDKAMQAFVSEYESLAGKIDWELTARWLLLRMLIGASFFLHPKKRKVRLKPPLLDKSPDPEMSRRTFEAMMRVIEADLQASDPFATLARARDELYAVASDAPVVAAAGGSR